MDTVDKINNLSDFQVIRFFKFFSDEMLSGVNSSLEEIQTGILEPIKQKDEFLKLESLLYSNAEENLNPEQSALIARKLLFIMAQDDTLEPLLTAALNEYHDDELGAGNIIAVGVAISMILVSATTALQGTAFGVEFRKETADAELVESILSPAAEIFSGFQGQ